MKPHGDVSITRRIRWQPLAAALLVLAGSIRIISTYTVFNHTVDEPDHLAAGMEWLSVGKYRYEDQHPPLARVFGALGPFIIGERWHPVPKSHLEGYRILGHGSHYDRVLSLGRIGILPFFWIASIVVYLWADRIAGRTAAVLALLLFTTQPTVLAHSGLITTDMAVTACTGAAILASLFWAEKPNRRRSVLFGVLLGLAFLSKFSALVFLPAAWLIMYVCHLILTRRGLREAGREITKRRNTIALILAISFFVVWAGYLFSFGRIDFLHLRLPAPRFFSGLHTVWNHNVQGHPSYLLGRRSPTGFRYYYFVALAVKTPVAMLALAFWMPLLLYRTQNPLRAVMPIAFSLAILLVVMMSRINIGVRHILPLHIGLSVACGVALAPIFERQREHTIGKAFETMLAISLLACCIMSGVLQHPDYIAYTNLLAGHRPERFVADSDLDWGQDMKRLGTLLNERGVTALRFVPFNTTYPFAGHEFPHMFPGDPNHPSPGWNAVSITMWKVFGVPAWAGAVPEQRRVGKSILLWYFPESYHPGAERPSR